MAIHTEQQERAEALAAARLAISHAVTAASMRHLLTWAEVLHVLAGVTATWSESALRAEWSAEPASPLGQRVDRRV